MSIPYEYQLICDFLSFTPNAHHLGDESFTQKFKTDTLPALYRCLYRSLTETHCSTASVVYLRSNQDHQVANTL